MYAHYICIRSYKEVHKKLCIPLPGLFQRGRLYKTQSCGSLVREKINSSTTTTAGKLITAANNTELKQHPIMTSSTIVTQQQNSKSSSTLLDEQKQQQTNSRHSTVLFVEKGKILRSRLSGKFLGNSDGDINQNENDEENDHDHISMIKTKSANTLVSNNYHNIDITTTAAAIEKRNSISTDSYCSNYISNYSNKNITKDNEIVMTKTTTAAATTTTAAAAAETASLLKQFYSSIATASTSSLSSIGSNNKSPGFIGGETTTTLTATLIASATTTATATALSLSTARQIKLKCCQLLPKDKHKLNDSNENVSSKSYNNDDNGDNDDDDDDGDDANNDRATSRSSINDKESLTNSSLHQLNDVPLCSSKC